MRRRDLIVLFGGAAVVFLAVGVPAQPAKTFRLGILVNTRDAGVDELLRGLPDHGYVEGQNLVVELRFSEGVGERWPQLAKELAALKVDAIVVQRPRRRWRRSRRRARSRLS
jgi:putative ABC transport system substrate-binding protein